MCSDFYSTLIGLDLCICFWHVIDGLHGPTQELSKDLWLRADAAGARTPMEKYSPYMCLWAVEGLLFSINTFEYWDNYRYRYAFYKYSTNQSCCLAT